MQPPARSARARPNLPSTMTNKCIAAAGAALAGLLLCQCGSEPNSSQPPGAGGPAGAAGPAGQSPAAPQPRLADALAAQRGEKETTRYAPSPLVDAILPELQQKGVKVQALNDWNNDQYFCNQLLSNVRNDGSLWLIFDRDDLPTVATLRKFFISQHRTSFDQTFDAERLILVHVHNELNPDAAPAARIGFEPASPAGWMITDAKFADDDLVFYVTMNAELHWQRLGTKKHGVALALPLLKDGNKAGVYIGGESGMIGLALSPSFATDHKLYTHYNWKFEDESRFAIVSEWTVDLGGEIRAHDERVLLKIPQSHDTHNGGAMQFGPSDGCFYITVGDGEEGQWTIGRSPAGSLRGKVLRIDLRSKDPGKQYHVPADNPFVGDDRFPPETWAWGFRNPWRMAFVPDGRMVVGDIGEDRNEEITFVERGRHHGWPYVEGVYERNPWGLGPDVVPVPPIYPMTRDIGMSVIGGYVYEGKAIPWLTGKYVWADFMSGRIFAIDLPAPGAKLPIDASQVDVLGRWPMLFTTFARHPSGELYVAQGGQLFAIVEAKDAPHDTGSGAVAVQFSDAQAVAMFAAEIPASSRPDASPAEIALGRQLYQDVRLSTDGAVSCATCHPLDRYGADGLPKSKGAKRNAPSTFNAHRQFAQFWDYRADTVEQAAGDAHGLIPAPALEAKLAAAADYAEPFRAAFPGAAEPRTAANAAQALGAFVRQLTTRSRWDAYLDGDTNALTAAEKRGLAEFVGAGCITCHQYRTLGGSMPQKLGLMVPCDGDDRGRAALDPQAQPYFFKVPGLLNVAKTAPYYHDGSIATLEAAIAHMAKVQLMRDLQPEQVAAIAAFLQSLTGEQPEILSGR